jgi:hypothetical protein
MAGKKITELSSSIAPSLTGVTAVAYGGITYKTTLSSLRQTLVNSGSHYFTGSQHINGDLTITGSIKSLVVGTGSFHVDNPEILHVQNSGSYNIAHFEADNQYYAQVNIKNKNSGNNSSTDLVLTSDNGSEFNHYIDLGINSSTYTGGLVGLENDAYLLNVGKDLYVGTVGGNQHPAKLKLFAQNNWENPQITISGSRQIAFNTGSVSSGYTYEFSGSLNLLHNININGVTNLGSTLEHIVSLNNPTTGYTHNFSVGSILYVTGATSNITVDIVNVPLDTENKGIGLTVMIEQGGTAFMVNSLKINSDNDGPVTIIWSGGSLPAGNINSYDIISFSILKINGTWKVFGQLTTF